MTSIYKTKITQTALCVIALYLTTCANASDKTAPATIHMVKYLGEMARKLDCYFTIEGYERGAGAIYYPNISDESTITSIKDLAIKLQRDLPGSEVVQDAENPAVIHIKANIKNTHYKIMDQKATLNYKGAARGAPDRIAKQINGGLSQPIYRDAPIVTPDDYHTLVEIKAKDRPVRNLLCDYLPLSDYSCILWLAEDVNLNDRPFIQFYYYGLIRPRMKPVDPTAKPKIYSFSEGRDAYFFNPLSDKLNPAAMRFITGAFQSGKTLNVRWSMYYLGRNKVESAILLLLSHLDYRYTTVPVLAEAYPAVHALLDIGKPATAAVQKQLTTETDPLRLQLLCAVLLGIHGAYDGRRLAAETAAKLPEAREKPIMDALRLAEEQIIAVPPPVDNVYSPHPAPLAP